MREFTAVNDGVIDTENSFGCKSITPSFRAVNNEYLKPDKRRLRRSTNLTFTKFFR